MDSLTPILSRTTIRGLQLLCECAENGVPARCAQPGQPATSEYLTGSEYRRYIAPLIRAPRPQFGSKTIRKGIDLLCQCAQFGTPASAEFLTKTETRRLVPALKWIHQLGNRGAEPVLPRKVRCQECARRRQQTPELEPFRKVQRAVRVRTGGWRLHLACGHTAFWAN
jgi:hypothetical protein